MNLTVMDPRVIALAVSWLDRSQDKDEVGNKMGLDASHHT